MSKFLWVREPGFSLLKKGVTNKEKRKARMKIAVLDWN